MSPAPRPARAARSWSRRRFLLGSASLVLAAPAVASVLSACGNDDDDAATGPRPQDADEALARLIEGNARFAANESRHADQTENRRAEVAEGQQPFATVLGCIDSRVPPELVFDEGLGNIFSVRVAGNIADAGVLGSIEFGVVELAVPLVVVLGHENCGAVTAAVEAIEAGEEAPGSIQHLVDAIEPAIRSVEDQPGDFVDNAVRANVRLVVEQLSRPGTITGDAVASGAVRVVGMRYDLDTGLVEVLD